MMGFATLYSYWLSAAWRSLGRSRSLALSIIAGAGLSALMLVLPHILRDGPISRVGHNCGIAVLLGCLIITLSLFRQAKSERPALAAKEAYRPAAVRWRNSLFYLVLVIPALAPYVMYFVGRFSRMDTYKGSFAIEAQLWVLVASMVVSVWRDALPNQPASGSAVRYDLPG